MNKCKTCFWYRENKKNCALGEFYIPNIGLSCCYWKEKSVQTN